MNISNNISSIQSHQVMMNTNANNIANANTDGFVPKDTKMSDAGGSVVANNRLSSNSGSQRSQTDLAKELTDQIVVEDVTALNVAAIKTQNEMMGTILDINA